MLTVPATAAPLELTLKLKLAVLSVEFVIASEKVAETDEFRAMPLAALAGELEDTVGGVVSGADAVVKLQL